LAGPSDAVLAQAAAANRARDKIRTLLSKLDAENARLTKNVQDRQRLLYAARDGLRPGAEARTELADFRRTARVSEYSFKAYKAKTLAEAVAIAQSARLSERDTPELAAIRNMKPGWV